MLVCGQGLPWKPAVINASTPKLPFSIWRRTFMTNDLLVFASAPTAASVGAGVRFSVGLSAGIQQRLTRTALYAVDGYDVAKDAAPLDLLDQLDADHIEQFWIAFASQCAEV
jgi:hypothetical protein